MRKKAVIKGMFAMTFVCALPFLARAATVVEDELSLTNDVTVTVASGDVLDVRKLTGYSYRLTKRGAGTLRIRSCSNAKAKITVSEGRLESLSPDCPAVVAEKAYFHVDASAAASLTTEVRDGTNFVMRWNDLRGEGRPYATRSAGGKTVGQNDPYLSTHPLSGRPVVDFGSLFVKSTDEPCPKGWGGALAWSATCARPREGFTVVSDTEDIKDFVRLGGSGVTRRAQALFGNCNSSASCTRGNPISGQDTSPLALSTSLLYGVAFAAWTVDSAAELAYTDASSYCLPDGFHVVSFRSTGKAYADGTSVDAPINAFACERTYEYGGQRIAESIVFDVELTAAERSSIRDYLAHKWSPTVVNELKVEAGATVALPDGGRLSADVLINDGTIEGSGSVRAGVTLSAGSLIVGGTAVCNPLATADAWFHVDANATEAISISASSSYHEKEVYCWSDVRGRKARTGGDKPTDVGVHAWLGNNNSGAANRKPWVNADYLADTVGLAVMDFNTIWRKGDGTDAENHPKSWFDWSAICMTPRTFLVVVADDENAKSGAGTDETHTKRDQAFIGNSCKQGNGQAYPIFGRANRASENTPSPYYLNGSAGGTFYCDGIKVLSPLSTAFSNGLHLVSIEMDETAVSGGRAYCNAFAFERNNIVGGQKLGEVLVFTNALSAAERQLYENMLMCKWGLGGEGFERNFADGDVKSGCSAEFPYQRLRFSGKLTIAGELKAKKVSASKIAIRDVRAKVGGVLDLPLSGEVSIELDNAKQYARQKVRLLACQGVTGDLSGWKVEAPAYRGTVRLSVEADGIYGTFNPPGLVLVVR